MSANFGIGMDASNMLMEMANMRAQAAQQTNTLNRSSGIGEVTSTSGTDFAQLLKGAIDNVNEMQQTSDTLKTNFELGDRSVSLADVMISSQKAGIALEAAVQVRNKMVEAYKTIMQMQL